MNPPLSKRQAETLHIIEDHTGKNGYAPSLREIGTELGLASVATVHQHVQALQEKGYIERSWNRNRSITVLGATDSESVRIPMLGLIAAGTLTEAIVQSDEEIDVPRSLLPVGDHFGLTVNGESMVDDGIRDGDVAIIKQQSAANNGQTVAVMVDGEVTLKKFYRKKGVIILQPANEAFSPIEITDGDVQIQGVLVALLRKYSA